MGSAAAYAAIAVVAAAARRLSAHMEEDGASDARYSQRRDANPYCLKVA